MESERTISKEWEGNRRLATSWEKDRKENREIELGRIEYIIQKVSERVGEENLVVFEKIARKYQGSWKCTCCSFVFVLNNTFS